MISQRWGDANVHTIGAALFAGTERIHFFDEIGYAHDDFTHCPTGDVWKRGRCTCDPNPSRSVGTSHTTQQITRRGEPRVADFFLVFFFSFSSLDYSGISCLPRWDRLVGKQVEGV